MSFSKAKIRRFNDIPACTPPPGQYNPNTKSKPTGVYISTGDRFKEPPQSPTISDTGSNGSTKSAPSNAMFAIPKKPVAKPPLQKKLFTDHQEALNEKIVECKNKDMFIKELSEQMEEMKSELSEMVRRNSQVQDDKKNIEERAELLKIKHTEALQHLTSKHKDELCELNEKIARVNIERCRVRDEIIELKAASKNDIIELRENMERFKVLYDKTCSGYKDVVVSKDEEIKRKEAELDCLQLKLVELNKNYSHEIDRLKQLHKGEQEEIELEMLKNVCENQKLLEKERRECVNQIRQLELNMVRMEEENQAKIKKMKEDFKEANVLIEMQMKEKQKETEEEWKKKLEAQELQAEAILKECQAIGEYNIIQSELEKNVIKNELSKKEIECQQLSKDKTDMAEKLECLQRELSEIVIELNEARTKLGEEIEKHQETIRNTMNDKYTYELTISKTHETIEALKTRLFNSDRDVEQLKAELETCERSKLEYEGRCNELKEEIKMLQEGNEELEMQNESTLKQAKEDVLMLKKELLKKVDCFQHDTTSELNKRLIKAEENLQEAMEQLHEQQRINLDAQLLISNANMELERLEALNTDNEFTRKRLESTISHLQKTRDEILKNEEVLKEEIKKINKEIREKEGENRLLKATVDDYRLEIEEKQKKLEDYEKEIEAAAELHVRCDELQKFQDKCENLEKIIVVLEQKNKDDEALIGPLREQLQAYELKCKTLLEQKTFAEQEAKEIGLKYAKILGHQNINQKIEHLVDLKKKNFELTEYNKVLEDKLRKQTKTIEKLKKEVALSQKSPRKLIMQCEDKENVQNTSRTVQLIGSPGPLRERQNNTSLSLDDF